MEHSESHLCRQYLICINMDRFCLVIVILVPLRASLYRQIRTVHHFAVLYDVMKFFHSTG